jgi:hypothetical protein
MQSFSTRENLYKFDQSVFPATGTNRIKNILMFVISIDCDSMQDSSSRFDRGSDSSEIGGTNSQPRNHSEPGLTLHRIKIDWNGKHENAFDSILFSRRSDSNSNTEVIVRSSIVRGQFSSLRPCCAVIGRDAENE